MPYCKGCGVELRPTHKPGRPRLWCMECKPTLSRAVRDDHDEMVILEEAAALEKEDREKEEREHKPEQDDKDPWDDDGGDDDWK